MTWVSLLVSLLLLLETAAAAPAPQRRRPARGTPGYYQFFKSKQDEGRFSKVILRNGFTLLVEERAIRPLAAVATYLKAGGEAGREWAADVIGCTDLSSRTRELGGFLEASTGRDFTAFISLVPADNVLAAMEVHATLLRTPEAAGADCEPAPEIPPETSPDFAEAALRRLVLGEETEAPDASPHPKPSASTFASANAVPARTLLAVSGDVRREKIYEQAVKLFARLKGDSNPGPASSAAVETSQQSFQYLHLRREAVSPTLLFGYRIPAGAARRLELEALSLILGEGRGSLLQRHLVRGGAALEASSRFTSWPDEGLFRIRVAPVLEKLDAAEVAVLALADLLRDEVVVAGELERVKALMIRRHYNDLETLERRAFELARRQALGRFGDLDARVGEIAAITAKNLTELARQIFNDSNLSLVELFPNQGELRNFTPEGLLETLRLLAPADVAKLREEIRAFQAAQQSRPAPPADFNPVFYDFELKRTSILRGPDIYLEEEHTAPLVHLGLFFPGGRIDETDAVAGITELTLRSLLRSLEAKQGSAFWFDLESRGASLSTVNEPEFFGFQVSMLSPHLPELLRLLAEWLSQPQIAEEGFAQEKAALRRAAAEAPQKADERSMLELSSGLFAGHPFSRGRFGTPASAGSLDLSAAQEWVKTQIEGYHPVILIRGDVAGTSFLPDLIPLLSNSKFRKKSLPRNPAKDGPRRGVYFAEPAREIFHLGFPGPTRGTRDDWLLDVLENLVYLLGDRVPSDDPSPRAYREARLRHRSHDNGGAVHFQARAAAPDLEQATRQARTDLGRIQTAPIRDNRLRGALVLAITRFYARQERKEEYLLHLARNLLGGEKPGFGQEYLITVKGVSAADLRGLASRYFPPSDSETEQISNGSARP